MNNPIVSIIVPCYKQAHFLNDALNSVLEQTYINWECIIVNDGSPDNTDVIASDWCKRDNRFKYFFKDNGGLSSARNLGIEKAVGKFLQFLDSDDILDSRKIELSLNQFILDENSNKNIVISNFRIFTNSIQNSSEPYCCLNSKLLNFKSILYDWDSIFSIPIHCGFFHSKLFDEFKFPENQFAKEDWVMWVSLFYKKNEAVFIDLPLAFYRINPEGMTMNNDFLPDIIKSFQRFKTILTNEEFDAFTENLISKYYIAISNQKSTVRQIKASNTYLGGKLIKKVLKKVRLIKLFRYLLLKIEIWNNIVNKNQKC